MDSAPIFHRIENNFYNFVDFFYFSAMIHIKYHTPEVFR